MNEPIEQREALWDEFLQRWPLEQLAAMTLETYNQAGADDSFCRWLEKHTESLGSIWGGSSLKFGIYSRANSKKDPSSQNGVTSNERYAWYTRYGQSEEEAFTRVRGLIVSAALSAREGRLDDIEAIDLWPIVKRKIAFLYQDRQQPTVLPIYLRKYLAAAIEPPAPKLHSELSRTLLAQRGSEPLLAFADRVYDKGQLVLQHEQRVAVLSHFSACKDLAAHLEAAQATLAFCDLALALHEQGLDWWITEAGAIHAGRTEDFRVWQVALVLRVDVAADATRICVHGADEAQWQPLDEALVDSLVEAIALHAAALPSTTRAGYWPDDYDNMADRLVITLTDGALRNGYLSVPKLQRLFPEDCLGESDQPAQQLFTLRLPDGNSQQTQVLKQHKRIQARFNALFAKEQLQAGDQAVLTHIADYDYQLSFRRAGQLDQPAVSAAGQVSIEVPMSNVPLNQILFGPPGTGKTYATVEAALEVLDSNFVQENRQDREALKQRFDQLSDEGRIRFVTFHQSFSYEDFVEGLRAENDEATGQLRYEVVDGVFKSLCEVASAKVTQQAEAPLELAGRKIWKMSLGNTLGSDASIYEECVQGGYMLLGYGEGIDFSGCKSRSDVQSRFADAGITLAGNNDYSLTSVSTFVTKMQIGDLVVVSDGNFKFRAIGEITGDYAYKPHADYEESYAQMRPVKWLRQYSPSLPHGELLNAQFSQMTLYELRSPTLNREKLQALLGTSALAASDGVFSPGQVFGWDYQVVRASADLLELKKPNGNLLGLSLRLLNELAAAVRVGKISLQDIRDKTAIDKLPGTTLEPYLVNGYNNILAPLVEHLLRDVVPQKVAERCPDARVLIIDEINRGNISRIFGELITLIEMSKRAGEDEALSVVLPYSKQRFSVPSNVHLIGTMNTTDRSLAGLDIALRRRFVFKEMLPDHQLLKGVLVAGIDIGELLQVINQRIEVLLDRDHCLGHAYFMSLKSGDPLARLESIFRDHILPLLQEYFFEDWQRIQWVLNDHRKPKADRFVEHVQPDLNSLFGSSVTGVQGGIWRVMPDAFKRASAYAGIIAAKSELHIVEADNDAIAESEG
jgi:5-methylcytosine-specific restriction protein B